MATSAEFNILPAYTPSFFLCLLCKELWVLGKSNINMCIVGLSLRRGYSNDASYFHKESAPVCFTTLLVSSPRALELFSFLHYSDFFLTFEHQYSRGDSWSTPGEHNLTLFTLLSAMQILLIWEELVDLSDKIIAPPSPLSVWLRFLPISSPAFSFLS